MLFDILLSPISKLSYVLNYFIDSARSVSEFVVFLSIRLNSKAQPIDRTPVVTCGPWSFGGMRTARPHDGPPDDY